MSDRILVCNKRIKGNKIHLHFPVLLIRIKKIRNSIPPKDLFGMFQIKAWTIPFWILWVERVNKDLGWF